MTRAGHRWWVGLCLSLLPVAACAQTAGVFAVFSTSLGRFTCYLDPARAPRTVANFVGLAEGSNAWLNLGTGEDMHTRFFDGTIFHRVVAGFVIQGGGQRVGSSFSGPGYSFRDEFSPELRHASNGILAMANSGPNSQGSQFYITVTPSYSGGDDRYSIFGHVSEGMDVVQAINGVSTTNDQPLVDVVLSNVTIVRIGPEAEAFDCRAWGLPAVGGGKSSLERVGTNLYVNFGRFTNSVCTLFRSTNWLAWTSAPLSFQTNAQPTNRIDVTGTMGETPFQAFSMAQVAYPDPIYIPISVPGRSFHMAFSSLGVSFDHWLGDGGTGTWRLVSSGVTNTGKIAYYSWTPAPYVGQLYIIYDVLYPMIYDCAYDGAGSTSNRVRQTVYQPPSYPVYYGTFTNGP